MELPPARIAVTLAVLLSCGWLAAGTAPAGTIERVAKQQILASIPPIEHGGPAPPPVLFLASPSGKYAASFVRAPTLPGGGGLGADFCYVEVVVMGEAAAGGGRSVWESECHPVSTVNTCALVFSWHGLEVFDGGEEVWHGETNTDGTNFLQRLELVDDGDMRIRDKDGELAWRASDEPRHAQRCGLAAALPPFAEPIAAHSGDLPFGQGHAAELTQAADIGAAAGSTLEDQYPPVGAQGDATAAAGFGSQPLVDNSPYDSGACKADGPAAHLAAIGAVLVAAMGMGF